MNNKIRNEARSSASDQAAAAGAYNGGKSLVGKGDGKSDLAHKLKGDEKQKHRDAGVARMRDEDEAAKKAQRDRFAAMKNDYKKNKVEAYDHPEGAKLSRLGRILMDKAITTKDDALSNVLSRVGDELTRYGAPGGARDIKDLEARTKLPQAKIMKLMSWADAQKDTSLSKVKDPKPSDEPDGEDGEFDEGGMPSSVIKSKQRYANMTDQELADRFKDSDEKTLRQTAWRHGYGNMSSHYFDRVQKGKSQTEDMQGKDNMGFTDKQIKMAYGVLNDPRYKGGNYSGAVEVINKIAPGLADHPSVAKALQRTNEAVCSECNKPRFVAMPESIQKQYKTVNEEKQKGVDGKVCWKGYKRMGTKQKGGKTVDNCVKA